MKNVQLNINLGLFFILSILLFTACGEDEAETPTVEMPRAIFEFDVVNDNSGTVNFSNLSIDADSYSWDFGDGSGTSTEKDPTYVYTATGQFTVTLTVTNTAGTNATSRDVSILLNLVKGADMSDASAWTYKQLWNKPNENETEHDFVDGAFVWKAQNPWTQALLYQEVAIEAGKEYTFNANIKSDGMRQTFFEVYFGAFNPEDLTMYDDGNFDDYSADRDGAGNARIYISSWEGECGVDPFDGDINAVASDGCRDEKEGRELLPIDGSFTLSADQLTANGTIYLVLRASTNDGDFGASGLTLDDISIKEKN